MTNSSKIEEILVHPEESQYFYGGSNENPEEEKNVWEVILEDIFKNSGCNHNRKFSVVLKSVH